MKGIPQGSILDPLLLNIFKNKLHKLSESTTRSTYADDTQIFYAGNDVVINCDLQRVDQWLDKNSMKRHPSKKVIVLDRHVIDIAW